MPHESDEDEDWVTHGHAQSPFPCLHNNLDMQINQTLSSQESSNLSYHGPLRLSRHAPIGLMTLPPEYCEATYRPVPDGKSVRLPFAARPVLRPADQAISDALGLGRRVLLNFLRGLMQ